jgi:chromosome segregation ATPase
MKKNKYEDLILLSKEVQSKLKNEEMSLEEAVASFSKIIDSIQLLKKKEVSFSKKLKNILQPIVECDISLSKQRMALHEMFTLAMTNIPDNEIDNYTAKRLTPAYLSFCQLLENVQEYK